MSSWARDILIVTTVLVSIRPALAQDVQDLKAYADARVDVSQLYTDDDATDRHINYTQLRGLADGVTELGPGWGEIHIDARGQLGWNDVTKTREEITRAFVQYDQHDGKWFVAAGRQEVQPVASTRVDGIRLGLKAGESLRMTLFGGLMPHPFTGDFNADFANMGLGYDFRNDNLNHSGGLSFQLYQGQVDRVFLTERFYIRPIREISIFGYAIVDFLQPSGMFGEIGGTPREDQSGIERVDLTNAHVTVRYQPARVVDFTFHGAHSHTILPNTWWNDWIDEQRQERGFIIDGPLPEGSRRSTLRLTTNVHIVPAFTTYVVGRYDHRHEDSANGYEARLGVKLAKVGLGYADLSGAHRRYFDAYNNLGTIQLGSDFSEWVAVDAGASILDLRPLDDMIEQQLMYDINATLWVDLGGVVEPLRGLRASAQYQAFIDSEALLNMFFFRLSYRFKTT